jgi:two-component system sensor histidine kinase KdpD
VAVASSLAAMLCINFFFLPPVGTFTIADLHNWVALFAFLAVSLVASNLSAVARARTREAIGRRDELARLFDLSRDVLLMTESREALASLARSVALRFDLAFAAVAVPREGEWDIFEAGDELVPLPAGELHAAFAAAQSSLEFDAHARAYAGHRTVTVGDRAIRLVPLRVGTKPIGILAAAGRPIETGTLDTLAGVVAIAIERAHLLEARRAGELARREEQLKTALLASIGHDLRTPLTAIRVAAANIADANLTTDERAGQSELILGEAERLTRLFQNILDMARIDAGAVSTESRWAFPSEIVAAARDQVEHTLQAHNLVVSMADDVPMRLDPQLTAAALAHVLENAAQYSPPGSAIDVSARLVGSELTIAVRDRGPGIAASDLAHLVERFYRGAASRPRASGTGMGLWIVKGMLAVEGGRVWAETAADGGATFTIAVPVALRNPANPDTQDPDR